MSSKKKNYIKEEIKRELKATWYLFIDSLPLLLVWLCYALAIYNFAQYIGRR